MFAFGPACQHRLATSRQSDSPRGLHWADRRTMAGIGGAEPARPERCCGMVHRRGWPCITGCKRLLLRLTAGWRHSLSPCLNAAANIRMYTRTTVLQHEQFAAAKVPRAEQSSFYGAYVSISRGRHDGSKLSRSLDRLLSHEQCARTDVTQQLFSSIPG